MNRDWAQMKPQTSYKHVGQVVASVTEKWSQCQTVGRGRGEEVAQLKREEREERTLMRGAKPSWK